MKAALVSLLAAIPALAAAGVSVGDSTTAVREQLGRPTGEASRGERLRYFYPRGVVEFAGDRVSRVAMLGEEEFRTFETRRAELEERAKAAREQRRTEGEALKAEKLASKAFTAAPWSYQVRFWEEFSARYPGVSCQDELAAARLRLAQEEEARREREIQRERDDSRDLPARIWAAEREFAAYIPVRSSHRYYHRYHGLDDYHAFDLGRVEYRWYESPLPYATSAGLPPAEPRYQVPPVPQPARRNSFGDVGQRDKPEPHRSRGWRRF